MFHFNQINFTEYFFAVILEKQTIIIEFFFVFFQFILFF